MATTNLLIVGLFLGIVTCDALMRVPLKKIPRPMPQHPDPLDKRIRQMSLNYLGKNHIEPINTLQYFDIYGEVSFGTPPQPLNVYFHTLSTELWVFSKKYSERCIICLKRHKYDHNSSSSYLKNGFPASGGFYSGNMSGYFSTDTVKVGGIQIQNQTFVEATDIKTLPYNMDIDGGFGLGLPYNNTDSSTSNILLNMAKQKLSSAIFSFNIKRNSKYSDNTNSTGEELILGGVATDLIDKDTLHYVPALSNDKGYWEIRMDKVQLGGVDIGCAEGCSALVIPNFPGFSGPATEINDIIAQLMINLGPSLYNCNPDKLPALSIVINNKNYTFLGKDYILMVETPMKKSSLCMPQLFVNNNTIRNVPQSTWILGNPFIAKVFTVFDLEQRNVGFAKYKNGASVIVAIWPIVYVALALITLRY